jgi:ubiquitin C-terminal hydrolase
MSLAIRPSTFVNTLTAEKTASVDQKKENESSRVQQVSRLTFIQPNRSQKARPLSERICTGFQSIPLIGHLLRAIIWIIAKVAAWIFGDPVESYKKSLTKKTMARLLSNIDTRQQQLSNCLTHWNVKGMSDLIRLTAMCYEAEEQQDKLVAFREQFTPKPLLKGLEGIDLPKAQRLEESGVELRANLKKKVELNFEEIQKLLIEARTHIKSQCQNLKELKKVEGEHSYSVRNARLLLLYSCDNYIRGLGCLLRLGLVKEEDVYLQKVEKICTTTRNKMGFKGHLPAVWSQQLARESSEQLELAPDEIGIGNIGNSCYLNSGLQMLFGMGSSFHNLVLNKVEQSTGEKDIDFKRRRKVQKSLQVVVDAVLTKDAKAIKKAVTDFRSVLFSSHCFETKGILEQQDGPRFVGAVLSALGFGIDFQQVRTVEHAGRERKIPGVIAKESILGLAMPDGQDELLEKTIKKEFLEQITKDESTPYTPEIDGKKISVTEFVERTHITGSIPDYLSVQFKRFNADGIKNGNRILCPNGGLVDLTSTLDKAIRRKGETYLYKVVSFQVHHGDTKESGHYTAYSHCPDGKWRHYDDSYVTEVSDEEAEREMGYAYAMILGRL